MTNEYYEKFGVSRQFIEYQRKTRKVQPFGILKGMNLYFKLDADIITLRYWISSFRRFIGEWEKTRKMRGEASNKINKILSLPKEKRFSTSGTDRYMFTLDALQQNERKEVSSSWYFGLRDLINQYYKIETEFRLNGIKPSESVLDIVVALDEFLFRVCSYKESNLSFDEYIKKEKILVANGKDAYDVFEYFLLKNGKKLSVDEIYDLQDDLMRKL